MPDVDALMDVAADHVKAVQQFIADVRVPPTAPGRPQCALFLTIAEQHEAAVRLLQVDLTSHAGVHIRGMFEALADQCLLGISEDHVRRMKYDQVAGAKRIFERVAAVDGLSDSQRADYKAQLDELTRTHAPLHEEFRVKKLNQAEAFAHAGLHDVLPYYTVLCSFAHNDLNALVYRHHRGDRMTHRTPASYADTHAFTVMSTLALMRAAEQIGRVVTMPDGRLEHHMAVLGGLFQKIMELAPQEESATE